MLSNNELIDKTVEITVAKMAASTFTPNEVGGESVADFMQQIYNKLVALNNNETD